VRWTLSAIGGLGFIMATLWAGGSGNSFGDEPVRGKRDPVVLTDAARKLHAECLLIDGHNDLPWRLRDKGDLLGKHPNLREPQPDFHTDIPRLKAGGVGAQFWSAWVPTNSARTGTAVKLTLEQIDVIHRMIGAYPDVFELARTADDIERIHKEGKIASLIGVEGGHSIDNSLAVLRVYRTLGVAYMTLTHSENVDWADSATDEPKLNGLSPFGEQVIAEMNRLGMMVDISHVSPAVMKHAIRVSRAPVIASHSSAFAVAEHPRNVPDDVLMMIKEKDGVVMVNFFSGFIVPEGAKMAQSMFADMRKAQGQAKSEAELRTLFRQWLRDHPLPRGSIHALVDHIDHIVKVAGVDHVGIGSDFDGISQVPVQLEDVGKYPYITQELQSRGYKPDDIKRIMGGNLLRVMRKAEAAAAKAPGR
jgi:membrane dipeptidase